MDEQANELRALMQGAGADKAANDSQKKDNHKTRIIAITSGKGGVGKDRKSVV